MHDEMGDVFDAIDNAEPSSAWIPENAGDEISGIVEGTMTRSNQYGEFPVVMLGTRDRATRRVSGFSGALRKRIDDANLQVGDGVKIQYTGWQKAMRDGKEIEFKGFEMAVIRKDRLAELRAEKDGTAGNGSSPEVPKVTIDPEKDLQAF
jgi:hypothetical protein